MGSPAVAEKHTNWPSYFLPLIAMLVIMLPFIQPLMMGDLIRTDDGIFHIFRAVALDHAIRQGDLWPRYVPGLMYGYGIPLFNYYSPFSLYPMVLLHALGMDFNRAFVFLLGLQTIFGALGAYYLGKAWGGPIAGLITAVGFAYSPFVAFSVYEIGSVSQLAAIALLPWMLYAYWRLAVYGKSLDFVFATITFVIIILSHNITAMYSTGILVCYGVLLWWIAPDRKPAALRLILSFVWAIGLAAFFWLPALGETGYINISRAEETSFLNFRDNFRPLTHTLSLPVTPDWTRYNWVPPITLGWPQLLLAGLAVIFAIRMVKHTDLEQSGWRLWVGMLVFLSAALTFLTTRASLPLWEVVPLLHFFQHPFRLLAAVSLFLAMLAGLSMAIIVRPIRQPAMQAAAVGLCLAVMMIYAMPWTSDQHIDEPRPAENIVDAQRFEIETGLVGTLAAGEYVPVWAVGWENGTLDRGDLLPLFEQSEVIPRLYLNPDINIQSESWEPTGATLTFVADTGTILDLNWVYFPGWRAHLDGQRIPVSPATTTGLVEVQVPEGSHTLDIRFGPTPLRRAADIASLVMLAGMVPLLLVPHRLWGGKIEASNNHALKQTSAVWIFSIVVGVLVLSGKVLIVDRFNTPLRRERFANGLEHGLETPLQFNFEDQLLLLGYDLPQRDVGSGESTTLRLYWQRAGDPIEQNYATALYLRDAAGNDVFVTESDYVGGWPTDHWPPEKYVLEELPIEAPPGVPPGDYTLYVRVYGLLDQRSLEALDPAGTPLTHIVPIGTLTVKRPFSAISPTSLELDSPLLTADLTNDLTLVAVEDLPDRQDVGQPFRLTWYWWTREHPTIDYRAQILWLDSDGQVAAVLPPVPPIELFPVGQWQARDLWLGRVWLHPPGRLESGVYDLAVWLVDSDDQPVGEQAAIGQITVNAPLRSYTIPNMDHEEAVTWDNGIHLLGYNLSEENISPAGAVEVTLYWQPQDDINTNLTMFMHLIDAQGSIIIQRDQVPVGGERPTLSWSPGEVIADSSYTLDIGPDIPPGSYQLRIGWYESLTGIRVTLNEDDDYWILSSPIIIETTNE